MNKRIMLLTALIAASPVLQVTASADAIYSDIEVILKDLGIDETDKGRLYQIQRLLGVVKEYKASLQGNIMRSHIMIDQDKQTGIAYGILGTVFGGVSAASHFGYLLTLKDSGPFAAFSIVSTVVSLVFLYKKQVDISCNKEKINELDAVIVKLEAMEKSLRAKVDEEQICDSCYN